MTAIGSIKPQPVIKSVTVEASVERAFDVFTSGFGSWWPATHSIGASALREAVIEPRAGGRWYEIGEDGSECEWGEVLAWERPTRLVLAWRIGADWRYDPHLLTEVEITFTQVGTTATRVELEHRLLENMGDKEAAAREAFNSPGGWPGLLAAYASMVG
ncbi:SRPBCC domain-containing protein [Rhizobium sp. ARZ01]|uniref:SRPBCC family protein n=1 Tax=Rhizobium sp. ARZ01 TaxID=2769313 RepID=UPI00177EA741|nr:SRPBCC family protein [Rhizobium sp. ARZ01]MBD9373592.1 SRPBCC domain-containing protein [Rhizobium sp. ARZ01]